MLCKTVDQRGERQRLTGGVCWQTGPMRQRDRDRGELVDGETRRRRGLGRNQGHLRVPYFKANSLTYFARALLDPRVLAVANSGAAGLRGVTPANWGNGGSVEVADEQEWSKAKNHGQSWTREVWPRCRWSLRTPARWSSRRSCQCGLTSAQLRERGGGALGGLAWSEMRWCGQSGGAANGASEVSIRCVATCGRCWSWQEGPSMAYGWQVAGHAAASELCPNWNVLWITRSQWLNPKVHRCFTLDPLDGFGSGLFHWVELHEIYKFAYRIKV